MNASKVGEKAAAGSYVPVLMAILLLTVLVFVSEDRPALGLFARARTAPQPQSLAAALVSQAPSDATNESTQTVHGQRVGYTIRLPSGWKTQSIGMEGVDNLSASQGNVNLAVMVQETKRTTADEAVAAALTFLKGTASDLRSTKPEPLVIDGKPWLAFAVLCRVEKDAMAYQYYVYSGSEGTYQIVAWTDQTNFERELPSLRSIMQTFRFPRPTDSHAVEGEKDRTPATLTEAAGP